MEFASWLQMETRNRHHAIHQPGRLVQRVKEKMHHIMPLPKELCDQNMHAMGMYICGELAS